MRGSKLQLLLLALALLSSPALVAAEHERPSFALRVSLPVTAWAQQGQVFARDHGRRDGRSEEPALPNITGLWTGIWSGFGVMARRTSAAQAEFTQSGRWGWGRIVLADTLAADVPVVVTYRGTRGVPVVFDLFQTGVVVKHEAGGNHLTAVFRIDGDRMVGALRGHDTLIMLSRQR